MNEVQANPQVPSKWSVGWRDLLTAGRLVWRLLWDTRVAWWAKLVPVAACLYVLLPFDLLPDTLPGIGQLDDAALLWAAYRLFVWLCPRNVVAEHRAVLGEAATWTSARTV